MGPMARVALLRRRAVGLALLALLCRACGQDTMATTASHHGAAMDGRATFYQTDDSVNASSIGLSAALFVGNAKSKYTVAIEGSAFLIFYYSGAVASLLKHGVITVGKTPMRGLSGGAITSALTHLGIPAETQYELWLKSISGCQNSTGDVSCTGHLNDGVEALRGVLPDNAHKKLNGRVSILISQLNAKSTSMNGSYAWVVDYFKSKDDVLAAIKSTDYISCFTGPTPYGTYRGEPVLDGGYSGEFDVLCPKGTPNCIKLSTYFVDHESQFLQGNDTSACPDGTRTTERTAKKWKNPNDKSKWKLPTKCPSTPEEAAAFDWPPFVPHGYLAKPDIYPGRYTKVNLTACEWRALALTPKTGQELVDVSKMMYELGQSDAAAWANLNGFHATNETAGHGADHDGMAGMGRRMLR